MADQNPRRVNHFGNACLGPFRLELPQPAKWTQLLFALGLNDSQALEAVKSDGERGEQLRKFVLRSFGHYFVPEDVIEAARRRRKEKHTAISLANQPIANNSNDVSTTFGERV
jgi:hypothetical protein